MRVFHTFTFLTFSMAIVLSSCNSGKTNRPSPPDADTLLVDNDTVLISFSSPRVKGRDIWGGLVPYGQIWRSGANEATYLMTTTSLLISEDTLAAGSYAIFTLPSEAEWIIIFNSDWDQWGAYDYEPEKDVLQVKVTPRKSKFQENMQFSIDKEALRFSWEKLAYEIPISLLGE